MLLVLFLPYSNPTFPSTISIFSYCKIGCGSIGDVVCKHYSSFNKLVYRSTFATSVLWYSYTHTHNAFAQCKYIYVYVYILSSFGQVFKWLQILPAATSNRCFGKQRRTKNGTIPVGHLGKLLAFTRTSFATRQDIHIIVILPGSCGAIVSSSIICLRVFFFGNTKNRKKMFASLSPRDQEANVWFYSAIWSEDINRKVIILSSFFWRGVVFYSSSAALLLFGALGSARLVPGQSRSESFVWRIFRNHHFLLPLAIAIFPGARGLHSVAALDADISDNDEIQ